MKKVNVIICFLFIAIEVIPQSVVTDPSSMAQRIALFLEQMDEAVSQSLDIAENKELTKKLFEVSKKSIDDLKSASQFIKTSRQIAEISAAQFRITDKIEKYSSKINEIESLSDIEKVNLIKSIVMYGEAGLDRVKSGFELVKSTSSDAQLSDYERLQILSNIEKEVFAIEDAIDNIYKKAISNKASNGIKNTLLSKCMQALTFSF